MVISQSLSYGRLMIGFTSEAKMVLGLLRLRSIASTIALLWMDYFLAVAEPEGTFEVKDTHLLVVAKEPFSCRIPCSNDRIVPDQKTSGQIQDVLATGLKKSAKEIVTKFAALRGSFTKHYAVQYVA